MKKITNTSSSTSSIVFKGVAYDVKPNESIDNVLDEVAYVWKKNQPFLEVIEMPKPDVEAIIAPVIKEVEVKKVVKKPPKAKVEVKKVKKLLKVIPIRRGRSKKKK